MQVSGIGIDSVYMYASILASSRIGERLHGMISTSKLSFQTSCEASSTSFWCHPLRCTTPKLSNVRLQSEHSG